MDESDQAYRRGEKDGRAGRAAAQPNNKDYMEGYVQGRKELYATCSDESRRRMNEINIRLCEED